MPLEHRNEKILREILGIRNGSATPADESENGPPISLAEFGQSHARTHITFPGVAARKDDAPPRGTKLIRAALPIANRFRFHSRAVS